MNHEAHSSGGLHASERVAKARNLEEVCKTARLSWRFVFLALCLGLLPCLARAAWWIDSYRTDFTVKKDGSLQVSERITANFTEEPHHGIYRDIPLANRDRLGRQIRYRIEVLAVEDGEGQSVPYRKSQSGGVLHLRLGDPKTLLQDMRSYRILYRLERWCLNYPDRQELYWNAIGNNWAVPIREAVATVELPEGIDAATARTVAFTGVSGAKGTDYAAGFEDGLWRFTATRVLEAYEGLTLAVTWPGKPVPVPGFWKEVLWTVQDNLILFLPLLTFIFLFWKWWTVGRDSKGRETIAVMYHPPEGISAAEAGALMDEKVDLRDITSSLVELASRGYLVIREEEEKGLLFKHPEFTLVKTEGKVLDHLPAHQQFLLEKLFEGRNEVRLSDLDTQFYRHLPGLRERIYGALVAQGYFARNPETIRGIYGSVAILSLVFGFMGIILISHFSGSPVGILVFAALLVTAALIAFFGSVMPAKTRKGVTAKEQLLGLEEYIQRAETETLKLEERQNVFEEILPYAMALGLSSKWSRVFSGIFKEPPSWYQSRNATGWNAMLFQNRLNVACSSLGTSMSSTPRSSGGGGFGGGGSAGHGGGGGGGGAW